MKPNTEYLLLGECQGKSGRIVMFLREESDPNGSGKRMGRVIWNEAVPGESKVTGHEDLVPLTRLIPLDQGRTIYQVHASEFEWKSLMDHAPHVNEHFSSWEELINAMRLEGFVLIPAEESVTFKASAIAGVMRWSAAKPGLIQFNCLGDFKAGDIGEPLFKKAPDPQFDVDDSKVEALVDNFSAAELRAALRSKCEHYNTHTVREGMTGTLGTVVCLDCGHEREWNAY